MLIRSVPGGYVVSNYERLTGPPYSINKLYFLNENGIVTFTNNSFVGNAPSRCVRDARGQLIFANGLLTRLTAQGDTLWSKRYSKAGTPIIIHAVAITADSNYVALGERNYQVQQDLVLLKIAPNGQVIRDTILYRPMGNEFASDILVDAQGDYVIYGWTSSGLIPVGFPDLILAKYRGWQHLLHTPSETATSSDQPEVFPNPTTDRVTLRATHPLAGSLSVRDVLGRVLERQAVDGTTSATCSLAAQPPGLYLLTFSEPARTRTWRVLKQ